MKKLLLLGGLMLVLLASLWAYRHLEIVSETIHLPPRGEAATNPLYATQQLLRHLGGTVGTPLRWGAALPPPGSTLFLDWPDWAVEHDRHKELQQWVASGGHLLISSRLLGGTSLDDDRTGAAPQGPPDNPPRRDFAWVPVTPQDVKPGRVVQCRTLHEDRLVRPHYSDRTSFQLCVKGLRQVLRSSEVPLWALSSDEGIIATRHQAGSGTVTVHSIPSDTKRRADRRVPLIFGNQLLEEGDHALIVAALLQAGPSRQFWFVPDAPSGPSHPSFIRWLWANAWVAMVLAVLATAAGLWRGARRFGPGIAPALPVRRSMGEQICGTAQFLRTHDAHVLHQATLNALDQAAVSHIPGYSEMLIEERARALGDLTAISPASLAQALLPRQAHQPIHGLQTLQLLETARRRLRHRELHAGPAPAFHGPRSTGDTPHADTR